MGIHCALALLLCIICLFSTTETRKMDETTLGTFLTEVNQLIDQFEILKQHAQKLQAENDALKKSNLLLNKKNHNAHEAVQSIIARLQEVKS